MSIEFSAQMIYQTKQEIKGLFKDYPRKYIPRIIWLDKEERAIHILIIKNVLIVEYL